MSERGCAGREGSRGRPARRRVQVPEGEWRCVEVMRRLWAVSWIWWSEKVAPSWRV